MSNWQGIGKSGPAGLYTAKKYLEVALSAYRRALLLALVSTAFATTTLIWLHLDRTPPTWDDAGYLKNSLAAYDALTHGGVAGYLSKLGGFQIYRAPLIAILPTPFYLVLGRHWHAAYLVNIAAMLLLFTAVYVLGRRWWNTRAGLFAILIVGTMPSLYGLASWFLVEYALAAVVAAAMWLLVESDGLQRRGVVSLFGAVCGFGLLLKISFPVFILLPFLYVWIKSTRPGRALFFALLPCLVLALPFYAFRLRSAIEFALENGYGDTAAAYGTGPIFSFRAITTYLSNVVRDGISGYYASLAILLVGWTIWRRRTLATPPQAKRPPGACCYSGYFRLQFSCSAATRACVISRRSFPRSPCS